MISFPVARKVAPEPDPAALPAVVLIVPVAPEPVLGRAFGPIRGALLVVGLFVPVAPAALLVVGLFVPVAPAALLVS